MRTHSKLQNSMFLLVIRGKILMATFAMMLVIVEQPVFSAIQVIDFEDLYPGHEVYDSALPPGYAGFNWSIDAHWQTSLSSPGSGYEYGTIGHVSMFTWYDDSNISMGGPPFDFLGAYITGAWNIDQDFTVEGWRSGSLIYSSYQITSYDSPYWFDFDFRNVDTVWFKTGLVGINAGLGG